MSHLHSLIDPFVHTRWTRRDLLFLLAGLALLWLSRQPFGVMSAVYEAGRLLASLFWGVGGVLAVSLGLTCILVGATHEARAGIRRFFRDPSNREGFSIVVVLFTLGGLILHLGWRVVPLWQESILLALACAATTLICCALLVVGGLNLLAWLAERFEEGPIPPTPYA